MKTKTTSKAHKAVSVRSLIGRETIKSKPKYYVEIVSDSEWLRITEVKNLIKELELHLRRMSRAKARA